jgi:predicted PurR-regulated permease PerM
MSVEGEVVEGQSQPALAEGDTSAGSVPAWLGTLASISWRILAVVGLGLVLLYIAILLSTVSASILVAFLVAATFAPIDQRLRARGWAPTKAASATSVVALVAVLLVTLFIVVGFAPTVADLIKLGEDGIDDLAAELQNAGLSPTAATFLIAFVEGLVAWLTAAIEAIVSQVGNLATVLILGGFLTFFILQDGDRAWGDVARSLAGSHFDDLTDRAWIALQRVGRYLRGTFLMSGIDAVAVFVVLVLLGVPFPGPLAVFVFLGGFVPYLGAFVTVGAVALVTWASRGTEALVVVLAVVVVTNVVEERVVAARVYGATPRISPALVLVALLAGASLFGILGLVVAVPVVAAASTLAPAIIEMLDDDPSEDRGETLVPLWLDRLGQWSWRALAVILTLAILIAAVLQVPIVTMPAILALVLTATLRPAVQRMRERGLGATAAAIVATVGSAVVVALVLGITLVSIAGSASQIVSQAADGAANAGLGSAPVDLVGTVGSAIDYNTGSLLRNLTGIILIVLLIMLLTYFLLRDGPSWWQRALARVPMDRRLPLDSVASDTADVLSGYMIGTGSIALFAGVTQWLMMALLGLPLALPIGVLTFFLSFIPYIGDLIATLLGFLVALAVGSTTDIVLMGVFTIIINIVQGNIIAPLVYRRTVSLHPAITLMAAPAGAAIGGMMGMFLVVPFLGVIAATWRTVIHLFDPAGQPAAPADSPPKPGRAEPGRAEPSAADRAASPTPAPGS